MNIGVEVENALLNAHEMEGCLSRLRNCAAQAEHESQKVLLLKLRCALRLLKRVQQHQDGRIGDMDLLCILRDFILQVGSIRVPERIQTVISSKGQHFDVFLNQNNADARLALPDWFDPHRFAKQAYCQEVTPFANKNLPSGDSLLINATSFQNYRSHGQKVAVHTALRLPPGFTLLVSLPTGGGKSLITQMLAAHGSGLTLAVVPTIALGLDQLRVARAILGRFMGKDAIASLCGVSNAAEAAGIISDVESGKVRLLFLSPESLVRNAKLGSALLFVAEKGRLENLVIDEAHIVSEWGMFFRPDFQMLSGFRQELVRCSTGKMRTFLLSATLTPDTITDLQKLYTEAGRFIELHFDQLREEPRFIKCSVRSQYDLDQRVLTLCRILPKPMILYEIRPQDAERWKHQLMKQGFSNIETFTGETKEKDRCRIISEWSKDNIDIVCATSAFGMGVDKPDVRTVIHASIPENINRFYQEVGRSGRDGLPSLSILFTRSGHDMRDYIISQRVLTVERMLDRWFSMLHTPTAQVEANKVLLDATTPPTSFSEDARERAGDRNMRWNLNLLLFLKRYGYLEIKNVVYLADTGKYFIRVALLDPVLMQNNALLENSLIRTREIECNRVQRSYHDIKQLANRSDCCVSEYFIRLFPHAVQVCGGCQNHNGPIFAGASLLFSTKIKLYTEMKADPKLISMTTGAGNMLISRADGEPFMQAKALELAKRLHPYGVNTLVLPKEELKPTAVFSGLVLSLEEFEELAQYHPSLLCGGLLCCFTEDLVINRRMYDTARLMEEYGATVIYYSRANLFISSEERALIQLINGGCRSYEHMMEAI